MSLAVTRALAYTHNRSKETRMRAWQFDRRNPSQANWPGMRVVSRASALIWVLCLGSPVTAGAEPLCPPEPFETNRDAIAATMADTPVTSLSQVQTSNPPAQWTLTDGMVWKAGGGLQVPRKDGLPYGSSGEEAYDAKRYIERYISRSWVMYPAKEPAYPPQHLVQTYSTTVVRPTVEEAPRHCLPGQPAHETRLRGTAVGEGRISFAKRRHRQSHVTVRCSYV